MRKNKQLIKEMLTMQEKKNVKDEINYWFWNLKQDVKIGIREATRWASDNRELVAVLAPAAVGLVRGTVGLAKRIDRKADLKKEQELKDLRVYNRSVGDYLTLRRKMTAKEQIAFEARKRNGEPVAAILYDMGLLK